MKARQRRALEINQTPVMRLKGLLRAMLELSVRGIEMATHITI